MRVRAQDVMPRVFEEGPWRMQMHIRRLDPAEWLFVSEHYEAEIQEKRRLLASGAEITAGTPEAEPAIAETLSLFESFLRTRHPELLPGPVESDPLRRAGLLVQEDLCWLAPGPSGYRLVAAFLAFPLRWRLADKIGRPLAEIHAPVPGLETQIGGAMRRFFDKLAPDRPVWRANWALLDDPTLHQPHAKASYGRGVTTPERAGHDLFVRVERQTLRRLPATGLVLFTIHTFVEPLREIAAHPASARALFARLDEMPEAMLDYKNLRTLKPAVQAYLMARAGAA